MYSWLPKVSLLLVTSLVPLAVFSADDIKGNKKNDETDFEKIIVVGSKMNQAVQEAPVSVTVFDRTMIDKAGMMTLRDIDDYAPNVSISQIGQVGGSYISIRGIESNPFIVNRTAVYVDGIPYRDPDMLRLHNVNQIEILRGPQGTLYGSNANAGIIVISTKTPYQELESSFGLSVNSFEHGQSYTVNGSVSGGVTEDLTAIVNVEFEQGDSYVRNISSSINEEGDINNIAVSSRFRYHPSDNSQLDFIVFYNKLDAPGLYEQEFPAVDVDLYNQTYGATFNGGQLIGDFEFANEAQKNTTEEEWGGAVALQHDFDELTFNLTASYRNEDELSYGTDFDLTAMPVSSGGTQRDNRYWNVEARLSKLEQSGGNWLIGTALSKEKKSRQLYSLIGAGGFDDYAKASLQHLEPQSWALFAQSIWPITDNLNLTTGLRYEHSKYRITQDAGVLDMGEIGQFTFPGLSREATSDAWVPKIALDYTFDNDVMLYTSASKGFLPGGYNLVAADKGPEIANRYGNYDDEELWSYELGAKSEIFNGKAFISAALFYIDAASWQEYSVLTDSEGRIISTVLVSSDAAIESTGFEIELNAQVTEKLNIIAGLGYVDASYSQYQFSATEDFSGNDVKMVPEYDISLSVSYDLSDHWYARVDMQALGETPLHQDNSVTREEQLILGLSTGYQAEHWSVRLYAKNLTNERYASGLAYKNFLLGDDGNDYAPLANPRVIGVDFDWQF